MRRKAIVTTNVRAWECRRYWRRGVIADTEVWHAGKLLPSAPRRLPRLTTEADYCHAHRARIYTDLACQYCGERPMPSVAVDVDGIF